MWFHASPFGLSSRRKQFRVTDLRLAPSRPSAKVSSSHFLPSSGHFAQLQFKIAPPWFWSCYKLVIKLAALSYLQMYIFSTNSLSTLQTVSRLIFIFLNIASWLRQHVCPAFVSITSTNNIYLKGYLFLLLLLLG